LEKGVLNKDPTLIPLHAQVISLRFLIKEKLEFCGYKTFLLDDIPLREAPVEDKVTRRAKEDSFLSLYSLYMCMA